MNLIVHRPQDTQTPMKKAPCGAFMKGLIGRSDALAVFACAGVDFDLVTLAHEQRHGHFHAGGGVPPLLTREILQAHNEELLNGLPVTGKTSGATSVPVRVHWGAPRSRLDHKDNLSYAGWYGGVLPHAKIVALSAHEKKDNSCIIFVIKISLLF